MLPRRRCRCNRQRVPRRRARVGGLCGFHGTVERVPAKYQKTGRCADVRERPAELQRGRKSARGRSPAESRAASGEAAKQPAMDLSRDKNAEEMKWSPLEMGAAKQAHGV